MNRRPFVALAAVAAVAVTVLAGLTLTAPTSSATVNPPRPERTITGWG